MSAGGRNVIEEMLWVLGHLINIEEHIVETNAYLYNEDLMRMLTEVRKRARELAVQYYYFIAEQRGIKLAGDRAFRNFWCILKHSLSLYIHVHEVVEMLRQIGYNPKPIMDLIHLTRKIIDTTINVCLQIDSQKPSKRKK